MGQEKYILAVQGKGEWSELSTPLQILQSTNFRRFYEHMILMYEKPVLLFSDGGVPHFAVLGGDHIYLIFEQGTDLFNNNYFMKNCFIGVRDLRAVITVDSNDLCTFYIPSSIQEILDMIDEYFLQERDKIEFNILYDPEDDYSDPYQFKKFLEKMKKKNQEEKPHGNA